MRIGAFTQIQQLYNTTQAKPAAKTQRKGFSDVVSISNAGKDVQTAKAAVEAAPDIRAELTNSIKARMDAGTYDVSADSFADKLLEKFNQGSFAL